MDTIGILGAGAMGSGIAQVAAAAGHPVIICDNNTLALSRAGKNIQASLKALVDKGKMTDADAYSLFSRIKFTDHMSDYRHCFMVIEAIVEDIEEKRVAFKSIEATVDPGTLIASNTSSLSISAMGAHLKHPERTLGVHFFNPAQVMRLVEEDTAYRNALRGIGTRLMDVGGRLSELGTDLSGLGKYAIEQANQRVGVPQAAREEAVAADQPQQE